MGTGFPFVVPRHRRVHRRPAARPTVAAFTATATERVRRDIIGILGLNAPQVTVTGFDRENLYFDVLKIETKYKAAWVARYVAEHPDESGIVYCATRKETEHSPRPSTTPCRRCAERRAQCGRFRHARWPRRGRLPRGMPANVRNQAQRDFVTDAVPVVVATNAFGMGIDKSNVRYVIHHNMPESIEHTIRKPVAPAETGSRADAHCCGTNPTSSPVAPARHG